MIPEKIIRLESGEVFPASTHVEAMGGATVNPCQRANRHRLRQRPAVSGFSVDQSVYLAAGDRAGIERLVGYMTRCPFSLSRLVKVTETGQVIYKAEKDACRAFPDPQRDELARGGAPGTPGRRNFQILDPLDFLAEFTRPGVPGAPFRRRART